MKISLWDGKTPVHGIPADALRESYPLPDGGSLAVVEHDDGSLAVLQPFMPGVGGLVAITPDNVDELERRLTETTTPPGDAPAQTEDAEPAPPA